MDKAAVYQYLTEQGIPFEATEHVAVYNMDELNTIQLPHPEWDAKNLFVRDDKKRNYYLITVRRTTACPKEFFPPDRRSAVVFSYICPSNI